MSFVGSRQHEPGEHFHRSFPDSSSASLICACSDVRSDGFIAAGRRELTVLIVKAIQTYLLEKSKSPLLTSSYWCVLG
jgi:hypothetical protein